MQVRRAGLAGQRCQDATDTQIIEIQPRICQRVGVRKLTYIVRLHLQK